MDEATIQPDLVYSVLCDDVRRESNGKLMLIGLFERINAQTFPAQHGTFFVVNKWANGAGHFYERTQIVAPNDDVIAQGPTSEFSLENMDASHTVIGSYRNVFFPEPGRYAVEVIINDDLRLRYPLIIMEVAEQGDEFESSGASGGSG